MFGEHEDGPMNFLKAKSVEGKPPPSFIQPETETKAKFMPNFNPSPQGTQVQVQKDRRAILQTWH